MKIKTLLIALLTFSFAVDAQPDPYQRFQFEPDLPYQSGIPSPESFLGYRLGEQFTLYADALAYFRALAEASDKLIIRKYGESYEGRELISVVITSEANHARMEELRLNNLKFANPAVHSPNELKQLTTEQPLFLSYSYNIHGNEASSMETAMQVSYRLVAATDSATRDILQHAVIIFYVCINPDGRDRYAYWYNSVQRSQLASEPGDLEHYAPWPNGRTNHYWFDLNRDWVWGVHPESRGHTREYQHWMPQVHVDYHEQGYNANYFTVPGTTPTNLFLQDAYMAWADTFGRANIAAFDEHDIGYFTRERFDFFYPSYGSSYPSMMGAIGMLTEQGGIGGGTAIETEDGHVLTLRQRVFDHYLTSVATIRKAVQHRSALQEFQIKTMDPANSKSPTRAYVLPAENNMYLPDVIEILLRNGVEVHRATARIELANALDFRRGKSAKLVVKTGDFVISTGQSRNLLINSILQPTLEIEDSVMYDMSTWSAALAYNLQAYSTTQPVEGNLERVAAAPVPAGGLTGTGDYAYVIEWRQRHAPRALSALWKKKYRVRSARKPFYDGETRFSEGSLIVLTGRNLDKKDRIEQDMRTIADASQVVIKRQATGRMTDGIDLTSPDARPVDQPKVALLVESPFSTYTCGQIYFLFDQESHLPVERVRASALRQTAIPKFGLRYGGVDLFDYDVLILPGGGNGLSRLFGEKEVAELKRWVQEGGVLVATESAAPFMTKDKSGITDVKLHEVPKDSSQAVRYLRYGDRTDYFGKQNIPGAALNAVVDVTHPLAFGLDPLIYSLKFGTDAFVPAPDLHTVGHYARESDGLLAGGYASAGNLKQLAGQVFAGVRNVGQGKVVLLLDNTQYRMFWRGPSRMMQNAVMLLPGM
ncbi:MAG: M14 family metallopeptidase [Saprospiraceae bacterium]|nr:M14 family metallopeptidase [Saprospiraceae bacterium]